MSAGFDLLYNSSQRLRGDEAHIVDPIAGYCVVNLRATWRVGSKVAVFARVENLFDKRYANFGLLGDATSLYPAIHDPRFLGAGAPRGAWIGVSLDL